jgi:hypothetical protein
MGHRGFHWPWRLVDLPWVWHLARLELPVLSDVGPGRVLYLIASDSCRPFSKHWLWELAPEHTLP